MPSFHGGCFSPRNEHVPGRERDDRCGRHAGVRDADSTTPAHACEAEALARACNWRPSSEAVVSKSLSACIETAGCS